ncbi:MAG: hypothetical protein JXA97_08650 [Anaerolineales bacterium]|nr:hypothetical protein [Anaerolineales bacterium]
MEPEQLQKKIEWLESSRRESDEATKKNEERLASLELALKQQEQNRKDLADELGRVSAAAQKINQIDEALTAHRKEISRQLDSSEKRRSEKEKNTEAVWKADQKSISRSIDELRNSVEKLEKLQNDIESIQKQNVSANRERDTIKKQLETVARTAEEGNSRLTAYGDDVRKVNREFTQLDVEIANLKKLHAQANGKVEALEDRTRRMEVRLAELAASEDVRQEVQEAWLEKQNLQQVEYRHNWTEWERRFGEIETAAQTINERLASYQTTYSKLKQMQSELEEVILRLERRINEVTEIQRLSENRQEQAWKKFQSDSQKRWGTFKLTEDERWRENERLREKSDARLEAQEKRSLRNEEVLQEKRSIDLDSILALQEVMKRWIEESSEDLGQDK